MDANDTMNKLDEATDSMNRVGDAAKQKISDVSSAVLERSRAAANSTDAYVHEYAWSSVALG